MNTIKYILIVVNLILSSFYLFPINFVVLPNVNTKMAMAAFSLVILFVKFAMSRKHNIDSSFLRLSMLAILVSLISYIAIIINNTRDYSYVTYFISMWVWVGGAYTLVYVLKAVHGRMTVRLLCNYFIAVCVAQCILAILIDQLPFVKDFVNSHIGSFGFNASNMVSGYGHRHRLYGIGAALDFSGIRFSAVLIMIAAIITHQDIKESKELPLYITSFLIIAIIGNMMSRTTTVGVIIAILYLLFKLQGTPLYSNMKLIMWSATLLLSAIFLVVSLYHSSAFVNKYLEFGFEGFFSIVRTGEWQTNSNDILINMIKFPKDIKTWLIGDGYFENPSTDIYYIGQQWKGFYMGTDIGYLRFIFYFGIVGLFTFCLFFCRVSKICGEKHYQYISLFTALLILNFVVWFKVSTDIFVVFAPFLCFISNENTLSNSLSL